MIILVLGLQVVIVGIQVPHDLRSLLRSGNVQQGQHHALRGGEDAGEEGLQAPADVHGAVQDHVHGVLGAAHGAAVVDLNVQAAAAGLLDLSSPGIQEFTGGGGSGIVLVNRQLVDLAVSGGGLRLRSLRLILGGFGRGRIGGAGRGSVIAAAAGSQHTKYHGKSKNQCKFLFHKRVLLKIKYILCPATGHGANWS